MTIFKTLLDRPRQWRARRGFFQVHLWAGVLTAIYAIIAALTGSALVFREELVDLAGQIPSVDPARGERQISPDAAAAALRNAVPGYRLGALVMPEHPGGAYGGYLLSRGRFVFAQVHPVTGGIIRVVTRENSVWRKLEDLHGNFLSGRTGRVVNGIGGVSLLLLCATGVVIWWPGRAGWKRALRIDWRARWSRLLWDLHGALGIWALAFVFIVSLTGVYHTWPQSFRSTVARMAPVTPRERPLTFPEARIQPPASVSRLLASAEAALGGGRIHSLQFPPDRSQAVKAVVVRGAEPIMPQADSVLLHPITAQALQVERHGDRPAGERILRWLPPLHSGRFAGSWSKLIWFVGGIAMALLSATGLTLWWNRVVQKRLSPAQEYAERDAYACISPRERDLTMTQETGGSPADVSESALR